ncbi:hypothetical protein EPUS_09165 [Endocarpon pusillum Z07020]|uniref:Major facilitator superfamily (MFS) profile domain-containing protein n=1 Tax=Endocarpon pusillum (strain Z07020 / HMAS-L-300199) TaxID=1263415 RepID=U1I103_ENDPU|nr:uncharacterized protein EPUS_09165 [Endocarpon pusillum Z07020]ERF75569.1 hypothetical protein EPUS_09165 [Endocarpon pusillum Z07020]
MTLSAVAIFVLASGISGGANTEGMLISGRAIQGAEGGGLNVMIDLIICDLVPLRERLKFISIVSAMFAIGTSMGPFVGGSLVQYSSWRWVFYLNLPIGPVALVMLWAVLHVKYEKQSLKQNLRRFDVIGSFLSIPSTVAILFALTYGGAIYSWPSWGVIVPLILGRVGLVSYHIYEALSYPNEPLIPPRLFGTRTSAVPFFATFVHTLIFVWIIYYLPVYFNLFSNLRPPDRAFSY